MGSAGFSWEVLGTSGKMSDSPEVSLHTLGNCQFATRVKRESGAGPA
jgi:hypothetical protein